MEVKQTGPLTETNIHVLKHLMNTSAAGLSGRKPYQF